MELQNQRRFTEAIAEYDAAIRLNPQYAPAYNNRGIVYDDLGEFERAIADFDEAIRLAPKGALVYNNRGGVYFKLGQYQRAIQDYNEAIKWLNLAAEQGDSIAQWTLGEMYENGEGFPQDLIHAHMWFNIAASAGYDFGRENRDRVSKKMNAEQIAKAQKLARDCVAKNYKGC